MNLESSLKLCRWVIALTLALKGTLLLVKSAEGGGGGFAGTAGFALIAFALIISGVLMTARDLAEWAATPIWRFISGLVFPDEYADRPPVNYNLPRSYRRRRRPGDSIEEYLKIVHYHPQELPAYLECLEVMGEIGDREGAEDLAKRGLARLRSEENRSALQAKLDELRWEESPDAARPSATSTR